jgi:ActR/RegA family two-component response regulator
MYLTKPHNTDELKNAIEKKITATPDNMMTEAMKTLRDKLEQCRRDGGKHLINVLFKK